MPNYQYPAPPPTISGDNFTISRFLQNPAFITRRLKTLSEQRFISDRMLSQRVTVNGGAIQFQQNESIYAVDPVETIQPGAEYPLTDLGVGPAVVKSVDKYGFDTYVTDEAIRRSNFDIIDRAMIKMSNSIVQKIDVIALAALAAAPIPTQVGSDWGAANAPIIEQLVDAMNTIVSKNQGYMPDTLVIDDTRWTDIMKNAPIREALPRETGNSAVQSGTMSPLLGLRQVLRTSAANMPAANTVYVLDSSQLGGMADELPLQGTSMRDDQRERWRLRVRRITVPFIHEPDAAVAINSV